LIKAKSLSKTIKRVVKKETRNTIQAKASTPDPRKFWQTVNNVLGKNNRAETQIVHKGVKLNNESTAEVFAEFFKKKVMDLSTEEIKPCKLPKPTNPMIITREVSIKH